MTSFILSMRSHTSENFLNEIKKYIYIYIFCIEQKKLLKKYTTV